MCVCVCIYIYIYTNNFFSNFFLKYRHNRQIWAREITAQVFCKTAWGRSQGVKCIQLGLCSSTGSNFIAISRNGNLIGRACRRRHSAHSHSCCSRPACYSYMDMSTAAYGRKLALILKKYTFIPTLLGHKPI